MFDLSPQNLNEQPPSHLNRDQKHFNSHLFRFCMSVNILSQFKLKLSRMSQVFHNIHRELLKKL